MLPITREFPTSKSWAMVKHRRMGLKTGASLSLGNPCGDQSKKAMIRGTDSGFGVAKR